MKLLIKQRVFSWSDTYDVYDEWEQPRYFVKAEFLTLGHQIHVTDGYTGQEVGSIHQKIFSLMPQFDLVLDGRDMGFIRKEFTLFHPRYRLNLNGWQVQGDVFGWEYDVLDAGGCYVMHITKELFHWGDTYVLDIPEAGNALLCLLIAIAIDAANCDNG